MDLEIFLFLEKEKSGLMKYSGFREAVSKASSNSLFRCLKVLFDVVIRCPFILWFT